MYRPPAFAIDDRAAIHAVIRARVFATVAAVIDGAVAFAYAPVVLDAARNAVRFHLARQNPLAALPDGAQVALSFAGPDAYISPDWYETAGMVPTWNYIAVEGRGAVRRIEGDALRHLLADVTAAEEIKLLPKTPWTIDKVPEPKMTTLLNAIVGFDMVFETLTGKFKLSQNIKPQDAEGAIAGLEARGDPASLAVAAAMRTAREK
jgi:transcriptional regulator